MTTLAFLGCAHIHTPGFIKTIKGRSDLQVKSVWDHDPERARKRAEELGAKAVGQVTDVTGDGRIDGVIICSETDRHQALVEQAAAAKKHMFVEKPLGRGAADSGAMADAIEKAGVIFQTGYFMRGDPKHIFLNEQIRKGNLGPITRARGSNCHSGALGGWFDTEWRWMTDPKQAGVGAFGDLGTHSLDLLIWMLGRINSVTGQIDATTLKYQEDCDEYGEAMMRFQNGVIGTLAAGWVDVANPVTLLVSGTEGHAAIIDGKLYFQSNKVNGADGKQPWEKLPEKQPAGFDAFLDKLAGKDVPLVSVREAAYRSAVMEAMYEGALRGRWITPQG